MAVYKVIRELSHVSLCQNSLKTECGTQRKTRRVDFKNYL